MSEAAAAMGLTSLESMDEFVAANHRNYEAYRVALADVPGVRLLEYDDSNQNNFQYVVVECNPDFGDLTRDEFVALCTAENILARRYFYPGCHRMEPYRSDPSTRSGPLPVTEDLVDHVLTLPTGTAIGPREITEICAFLRFAICRGEEIASRMRQRSELRNEVALGA
jgi:dTDP-4-amino-4,6-dideoxygalactose transaminase